MVRAYRRGHAGGCGPGEFRGVVSVGRPLRCSLRSHSFPSRGESPSAPALFPLTLCVPLTPPGPSGAAGRPPAELGTSPSVRTFPSRAVKGRCGPPLRSVSSLSLRSPLDRPGPLPAPRAPQGPSPPGRRAEAPWPPPLGLVPCAITAHKTCPELAEGGGFLGRPAVGDCFLAPAVRDGREPPPSVDRLERSKRPASRAWGPPSGGCDREAPPRPPPGVLRGQPPGLASERAPRVPR